MKGLRLGGDHGGGENARWLRRCAKRRGGVQGGGAGCRSGKRAVTTATRRGWARRGHKQRRERVKCGDGGAERGSGGVSGRSAARVGGEAMRRLEQENHAAAVRVRASRTRAPAANRDGSDSNEEERRGTGAPYVS